MPITEECPWRESKYNNLGSYKEKLLDDGTPFVVAQKKEGTNRFGVTVTKTQYEPQKLSPQLDTVIRGPA